MSVVLRWLVAVDNGKRGRKAKGWFKRGGCGGFELRSKSLHDAINLQRGVLVYAGWWICRLQS